MSENNMISVEAAAKVLGYIRTCEISTEIIVIQIQGGHNAWMRFRESDPNWEKFKKPSENKRQTAFMQVCTPKKN